MKERREARPNHEVTGEAASELVKREQEAWQRVLGTRIEVKLLPESVTVEVKENLERMGFSLRYVPALDIGNLADLRERGVDEYLTELQRQYPKWRPFESLSDRERGDHTVPRNLAQGYYWRRVRDGSIAFPVLPGQWMGVETVDKPTYGDKYARTPFAESLGVRHDRFCVSWNDAHNAIEREKARILSDIGISERSVDLRFLEALEWNLLGNREGWGKTNTYEWTSSEYRDSRDSFRLTVGGSARGGASNVSYDRPAYSYDYVGYRAAVVLGS